MAHLVDDLMSFTGLGREEAAQLLEASNFDLAAAATLHFEQQDGRDAGAAAAAVAAAAEAAEQMGVEEALDLDPEEEADRIEQAAAAARAATGAPPAHDGYFERYPRLRYCLELLWRTPGVPLLHSCTMGLGRLLYSLFASGFAPLIWASLQLLGLVPAQARPPSGPPAAQRLQADFEAEFGTTHPTFFRGSCHQALSRSRQEAKFVLACLYSPGQADSNEFSRRVLSSPLFSEYVDESFVFWMGDVGHPEGRAVLNALRPPSLPALSVLAHGDMAAAMNTDAAFGGGDGAPPARALAVIQGPLVADEEHRYEPMLVAARAELHERAFERQLREQQEEEYARALAEDQAREAAEAEEQERQAREAQARQEELERAQRKQLEDELAEANRREARRAKAAALPAEPTTDADATRVVIRMPDGQRLSRRFAKECKLQAVVDFVESADPDIYDGSDFDLVSNYPRKVFAAACRDKSLEELELHPATTLFTKEQDE